MENPNVHPHARWSTRLIATCAWLAMAVIFGATGGYFGVKPLSAALENWWTARDYQATEATVSERTGSDADGAFTWYVARYRIGEQTYQTQRLSVLDDDAIDEPFNERVSQQLADAYKQQKTMTVWVSPRKPEIAVVSRDLPWSSLWQRIPLAIGFVVMAIAGALGAPGALFGFAYYQRMADAAGLWLFSAMWCGFTLPIFMVVTYTTGGEWVPIFFIGLFVLIGVLMLYGAVMASIRGVRTPQSIAAGERGTQFADALAARVVKHAQKRKAVSGNVKRGGLGGRGDGFDKD
jgi:hypothetical protein